MSYHIFLLGWHESNRFSHECNFPVEPTVSCFPFFSNPWFWIYAQNFIIFTIVTGIDRGTFCDTDESRPLLNLYMYKSRSEAWYRFFFFF